MIIFYFLELPSIFIYILPIFQIIYLVGWKPDPSQPKPIERGSGEVNLKNLFKRDNEDQKGK